MYEIWLDIPGFEGRYQASNLGRIKSLKSNKILSATDNGHGYKQVSLYKNGKNIKYKVHRLVMITFKANPDNKAQVNHINEDKSDNRLNNLEWCDNKYNVNYGSANERRSSTAKKSGLYDRQAKQLSKKVICVETGVVYDSIMEAARENDLKSYSPIGECCNGKKETAKGLHWRFYETSI